jgi:galactokinase
LIQSVTNAFSKRFGRQPKFVVQAPGRVNIIGEHTDYNNGFVLPMAIDRGIWIALNPRDDRRVELHSLDFSTPASFSLDHITPGEGWTNYLHGIAWILKRLGFPLSGWEGVLASNIPIASGLSSSAALELAAARAFWSASPWDWNSVQMAKAAQAMENEWLGLKSGIMDQMISAAGVEHHALLIDCRSLETELIPFPADLSLVVMDTRVQRGLVNSAYNERVAQCKIASDFFEVDSLREVSTERFLSECDGLEPLIQRRARHVIFENLRTEQAALAMRTGQIPALAELINASHNSLRDDYQVSSKELDFIVDLARQQESCFAARMTGAGFGGCALALVEPESVSTFIHQVKTHYQDEFSIEARIFETKASQGAR